MSKNKHRCAERVEDRRCILPVGHKDGHLTRGDLERMASSRCLSTKGSGSQHLLADIFSFDNDQCVKWKGHRGHHLFASELAEDKREPGLLTSELIPHLSVARGGIKFRTGSVVKPAAEVPVPGPVIFRGAAEDIKAIDPATCRCPHVEPVPRSTPDGSESTTSLSRCTKWAGHHGDHGFMFEAEVDDIIVSVEHYETDEEFASPEPLPDDIIVSVEHYETDEEFASPEPLPDMPTLPDEVNGIGTRWMSTILEIHATGGRRWTFHPPVPLSAGDKSSVGVDGDVLTLAVVGGDGITRLHGGVPQHQLAPLVPPESVIARDGRYQDIPVVEPPAVPPEKSDLLGWSASGYAELGDDKDSDKPPSEPPENPPQNPPKRTHWNMPDDIDVGASL